MVWRFIFQIALVTSAMGYTSPALASTKGQSIVDCALEKASESYETEVYLAFKATVLADKELSLDREAFLALFANCGSFSKLAREDQIQIGFSFIGAVLEAGAAPRLRSAGINLAELDDILAPLSKGYSVLELFDSSSKRSDLFAESLDKRFEAFFGDQYEAVFAKSGDALVLYSIGLLGRQAVAQDP